MTQQVMSLARGKVVLALEGGYDLPSICDSSQECVSALLDGEAGGDYHPRLSEEELNRRPHSNAVDALRRVVAVQDPHWPLLKRFAHLIDCSHHEAVGSFTGTSGYNVKSSSSVTDETEAVTPALASLTMTHITTPAPLTSNLTSSASATSSSFTTTVSRGRKNTRDSTDTGVVMEEDDHDNGEEPMEQEDVEVDK